MNESEILLSRLSEKDELLSGISAVFGADKITDYDKLNTILSETSEPVLFRIYVSNENITNEAIDKIIEIFKAAEASGNIVTTEIIEDEFLNIIDESGIITSKSKPRKLVHRDGDLHPTVHVWVMKRMDMGVYVVLQKRSDSKETHPGCYDVSAAGHVTQGDEFRTAAVRELYEELGIKITPEKLIHINNRISHYSDDSEGVSINDNEYCCIYLYHQNVNPDELVLRKSEVSEVCWAEVDELLSVMDKNIMKHCISADELKMIKKAVF